jgi:hypothetical protein
VMDPLSVVGTTKACVVTARPKNKNATLSFMLSFQHHGDSN